MKKTFSCLLITALLSTSALAQEDESLTSDATVMSPTDSVPQTVAEPAPIEPMPRVLDVKKDEPKAEVETPKEETVKEDGEPKEELPVQKVAPIYPKGYYIEDDDTVLPSPTANFEAYEEARLKKYHAIRIPKYSLHVIFSPRAFRKTDFRNPKPAPRFDGKSPSLIIPAFYGLHFGVERHLTRSFGVFALGIQGGLYFSKNEEGYQRLLTGLPSVSPTLSYQLLFFERQIIIPTIRGEYEIVNQFYGYEGNKDNKVNFVVRGDAGILLSLGFLDREASGDLYSEFKVKRTMIGAFMTVARDRTKKNIDLSERSWRIAAHFEY